jgi:hypothetical protein
MFLGSQQGRGIKVEVRNVLRSISDVIGSTHMDMYPEVRNDDVLQQRNNPRAFLGQS